ncbi:DNA helicase RecQ [Persicitalea sp.]|uniref:DNA helicase RecQ n=1 Tax=Persicitalea sp. TaxID=3100273 RepID=UPI0035946124
MPLTKERVLKQYFGYDSFRPQQAEIIDTVLRGEDCLVLMPTGGGKSVCYQVPALLQDGLTVVISPLIALMKDQVEALRANGIEAAYLNSSLSGKEQDSVFWKAKLGELKLLYVAPERLFSGNTMEHFKSWNVRLFAVDEAHCISSWGHDFRPEYRQLSSLKNHFPGVPVIALTATADRVTRRDILGQLGVKKAQTFVASFDRPNLSLTVLPSRKRLPQIEQFLKKHPNQPGIIYCLSRKTTETVASSLQNRDYRADCYHAGLSAGQRSKVQEQFLNDDIQIIVATIAFGMGIDKSNVRWVIHYNLPPNVESFYQEIGRSGRDGAPADTVLFYGYQDIVMRQEMIDKSEQSNEQKELLRAKLERMKQYAEADLCRRRILLSYFNEAVEKDCGNCDVCQNPRTRFDGTLLAQKALSGIARTGERVAMGMLIDILRGSRNRALLDRRYDQLPTFGVGRDLRGDEWAEYLSQMLNSGVMDIAYDEAHAFKLNASSWQILKEGKTLELAKFIPFSERKAREEALIPKEKPKQEIIRDALFEQLRLLRKQMADALNVPPYVIFSDKTISEMAQKRPVSEAQMLDVSGVGDEKYRRYGEAFVAEIVKFAKENTKPGTRVVKGMTYLMTRELYERGFTLDDIAQQRGLTTSTVVAHLVKLRDEGYDIQLRPLIADRTYAEILIAADEMNFKPGDPLASLFEHLGERIEYGMIRLALAIREGA